MGLALREHAPFVSWIVLGLALVGASTALLQLYTLNVVMKYYEQVELVPIYQSLVVVFSLCSGLVLFDESALYTWGQLLEIIGAILLVIIGIFVLALKHNLPKLRAQTLPDELRREETPLLGSEAADDGEEMLLAYIKVTRSV